LAEAGCYFAGEIYPENFPKKIRGEYPDGLVKCACSQQVPWTGKDRFYVFVRTCPECLNAQCIRTHVE
jgi:hypothetical protein